MSNWIVKNGYLTTAQMQNNAQIVYSYFTAAGWTMNAIAGMLGNMEAESNINPGIWESLTDDPEAYYNKHGRYPGYGIVQWTPYTKFRDWAGADWNTNPQKQLDRIIYEMENGIQYYPTSAYPETFRQFSQSTKSAYYLGGAFLYNYERPAEPNADKRGRLAEKWYTFLGGVSPDLPPPSIQRERPPIWLLFKIREKQNRSM